METQNYSLKWKDFAHFTKETIGDLLMSQSFTDVTLICEDGRQVEGHKVVLAAGSLFFQDILVNNHHPKPMIILKGINYEKMMTMLKFCYLGQADLPQEDLQDFLKISRDLKIKGMDSDHEHENRTFGNENEVSVKTESLDDFESPSYHVDEPLYIKTEDDGFIDTQDPISVTAEETKNVFIENDCLKTMKTKKKKWFYCEKCDYKASNSTSVKYHHQTVHEGFRFDCDLCDAYFTRKESLKTHKRSIHEGIRYPCDMCNYKATESGALKKHKLSQHGIANMKYVCKLCKFSAKTSLQLKMHTSQIHKEISHF